MPHVNFLEPKHFVLPHWEWNYLMLFSMTGAFLIAMVSYGVVQKFRLNRVHQELTVLSLGHSAGATSSDPAVSPPAERVLWSPVLHAVAEAAARSVRLTSLKASVGGGKLVDIEGEAGEVQGVAHFRDRLNQLPLFSKVLLVSSEAVETESKRKMQRFHLQAWLREGV